MNVAATSTAPTRAKNAESLATEVRGGAAADEGATIVAMDPIPSVRDPGIAYRASAAPTTAPAPVPQLAPAAPLP